MHIWIKYRQKWANSTVSFSFQQCFLFWNALCCPWSPSLRASFEYLVPVSSSLSWCWPVHKYDNYQTMSQQQQKCTAHLSSETPLPSLPHLRSASVPHTTQIWATIVCTLFHLSTYVGWVSEWNQSRQCLQALVSLVSTKPPVILPSINLLTTHLFLYTVGKL